MAEETTQAAPEAAEKKPVKKKKKSNRNVSTGVVHILSTFNNTIITVTDASGNVLSWSSAGSKGFKGSKKSTPFAAQLAAEDALRAAQDMGLRTVTVFVKGPGAGREAAMRVLGNLGYKVIFIKDVTPIPHNGCRPPKRRRI